MDIFMRAIAVVAGEALSTPVNPDQMYHVDVLILVKQMAEQMEQLRTEAVRNHERNHRVADLFVREALARHQGVG